MVTFLQIFKLIKDISNEEIENNSEVKVRICGNCHFKKKYPLGKTSLSSLSPSMREKWRHKCEEEDKCTIFAVCPTKYLAKHPEEKERRKKEIEKLKKIEKEMIKKKKLEEKERKK